MDGSDEGEGTDQARKAMIDLLFGLPTREYVKVCLSSRPRNIFQDAFESCPRLKLGDLTSKDIQNYVRGQLDGNRRFCNLMRFDMPATEALMASIMERASGVFLWVRLVVRETLTGVRDATVSSRSEEGWRASQEIWTNLLFGCSSPASHSTARKIHNYSN